MEKKQISLQVYSARNFKPYEDIFKFLSEEGMKNVELFEVEAFNETKELLDKYNLISLSSHIGFDTLIQLIRTHYRDMKARCKFPLF